MTSESLSYDLDGFLQLIFYNANFNVHSFDGYNTFHSMGGIAFITPSAPSRLSAQVPRIRNITPATILESVGNVPIKNYNVPTVLALKSITIKDVTLFSDNEPRLQSINALNYL